MTELLYYDKPMRWQPVRVRSVDANGPLEEEEPTNAPLLFLMGNGYALIVELEPGDMTHYCLIVSHNHHTISCMRVGGDASATAMTFIAQLEAAHLKAADCAPLAPHNEWSQTFFAWWLNGLMDGMPLAS